MLEFFKDFFYKFKIFTLTFLNNFININLKIINNFFDKKKNFLFFNNFILNCGNYFFNYRFIKYYLLLLFIVLCFVSNDFYSSVLNLFYFIVHFNFSTFFTFK